ncbi:RIP metalloprotease RseP [Rhodomicrobium vannielii ATCC 17100]|uniref:RIP metalloprotease RseP n=1 Tax=Rhodomicrobium vannielii TaxID=1069 RepID=UPI001918DEDA|nr:RIP metalloprotease RseP [Rhodomicrobium vannielii]MBJ7534899.1 RIP metalloprotease RseP [Rhodomicrobium vannielii ATCC 17100]
MILSDLSSAFGQFFLWTVPFLLVLGVVVIIHELGHFLAARALGVKVETFSIGFGPEIAGFVDRSGIRWRLAWVPLGGYVKFKGDENASSVASAEEIAKLTPEERRGNFHTADLWRRTLIVLAGPFANFALGIAIFAGLALANGISYQEARIVCVEPNTPAAKAGLEAGDKILSIGGRPVKSFEDFSYYVKLNARSTLDIEVDRGGRVMALTAVPELTENECIGRLGVMGGSRRENARIESVGLAQSVGIGVERTWRIIEGPFQFFGQLFKGNACASTLGGPVKIAEVAKTFASDGFLNLIPLIAFISISVGLFNLFPIPVLDGGHLLFYGAEAILGRPLSQRAQEIGFQFGFTLLIMLMIFVTWNNIADITRGPTPAPQVESVCRR